MCREDKILSSVATRTLELAAQIRSMRNVCKVTRNQNANKELMTLTFDSTCTSVAQSSAARNSVVEVGLETWLRTRDLCTMRTTT